jgi:hypothetical protein
MRPAFTLAALAAALALRARPAAADADLDRPQYICLNKAFPGGWLINDPSTFTQASIDAILAAVGGQRGSANRKLCVSFNAWTLIMSPANETTMLASIDALLALALANELPLSISLDPTQWWDSRPDLWNWFDPSKPGFSPANVANVEWTGPSPANATLISWRNWGSQFRLATPHPNFASVAFRGAAAASVTPLAARIAAWYRALPVGKKWLLAYVRATQELWVGTNYYYYANGNVLAPESPANDPTGGPGGAAVQLGYAAVCGSAGSGVPGCSGKPGDHLSVAQLDAVVSSFAAFAAQVLLDAGIPRSRVMVHTGAFFGNAPSCKSNCSFNSPQAALVQGAYPAWSLYGAETFAADNAGLPTALNAIGGAAWGACEWLPFFSPGHNESDWSDAFEGTLRFLNNRLIVVQNFESIEKDGNATAAVAAALGGVSCVVDAPTALAASVKRKTSVAISWTASPTCCVSSQILIVSSMGLTLPNGNLAVPDVATAQLGPDTNQYNLQLPAGMSAGEIFVQVVTYSMQGCGGPGQSFTQSVPSDALVVSLT